MAMESSKLLALLFTLMVAAASSADPVLECGTCHAPKAPTVKPPVAPVLPPIIGKPPITLPPIIGKPPTTLPPVLPPIIGKPPITLPPVLPPIIGKPPITLPPIIGKPPITLPPVLPPIIRKPRFTLPPVLPPIIGKPPVTLPPIAGGGTPSNTKPGCRPVTPAPAATCPIDTLKLGACVDLLGGLVHVVVGDPVVNQCCPLLGGLAALEAAECLCTTIKLKALNIPVYLPIALELLVNCGQSPPPGFKCA